MRSMRMGAELSSASERNSVAATAAVVLVMNAATYAGALLDPAAANGHNDPSCAWEAALCDSAAESA